MNTISIIIPVSNAEKYLRRCLSSIFIHPNLVHECIIVNDHSTDKSLAIAKEFKKRFPSKIKIISSPFRSAGAARNLGMGQATGKMIWFVDADDYISESSLSKLHSLISRYNLDLIMFAAEHRFLDGNHLYIPAVSPNELGFKHRFVRLGPGPWQFLFNRHWWTINDFQFKEGIIHEDIELLPSVILYAKKCESIEEPLYYYCENPSSVLHSCMYTDKCLDIFPALEGLYARFQSVGAVDKYADDLEWLFIWNLLNDSAKDFRRSPEGDFGILKTRVFLNKYFPNWRKNPFLKKSPAKLQLKLHLNYYRRPKM